MRKNSLVANEFFHIYNRGVDKRNVFQDVRDYERFLLAMDLLNDSQDGLMIRWRDYKENHPGDSVHKFWTISVKKRNPLVEIMAYCFNPNHYHFLMRQTGDNNGIRLFMQRLGNSYTKYFNEKNGRNGVLFQGRFKSSIIKPNDLLRTSVYVNCNSEIHGISPAGNYKWCSFPDYLGKRNGQSCKKKEILSEFKNSQEYFNFAKENIADFRERKRDEKIYLE